MERVIPRKCVEGFLGRSDSAEAGRDEVLAAGDNWMEDSYLGP